jgi:hypothetical protein
MNAFRSLLLVLFAILAGYTAITLWNHGFTLFPIFVGDMAAMSWRGQFNVDFTSFLTLSALWIAWRHEFSAVGIALGVLGFFGGALVLTAYLFFASLSAQDDVRELFLGKARAAGGPARADS